MVVKKNQALPTAEILLIDSSAVKSLLFERLEVAALQTDDHHRRQLVVLELRHRWNFDVAGAHLVHEAGVDARRQRARRRAGCSRC